MLAFIDVMPLFLMEAPLGALFLCRLFPAAVVFLLPIAELVAFGF